MRLSYVHLGVLPNQKAHAVQIFNTCAALAAEGAQLQCVADHEGLRRGQSVSAGHWPLAAGDYFGVESNFELLRPARSWRNRFKRQVTGRDFLDECVSAVARMTPQADAIYTRSVGLALELVRRKLPTVVEIHNLDVVEAPQTQDLIRGCHEGTYPGLRAIIAISQVLADGLAQHGAPQAKLLVAHDGIDVTRFAQPLSTVEARELLKKQFPGEAQLLDAARPVVGYCGHFYQGRGIEMLLECARRRPEWSFLLIGGFESDVERYRQLAARDELQNVIFTGYIANTELAPYMWACDVLAMPYETEQPRSRFMSPMKMFEYMAAGRAIVSADWPQIREVLRPDQNALLHARGDRDDLEKVLERALSDPALRERLSQTARRDVENYTWRARARRILDSLEQTQNVR